jgi:hypothetical protein
LPFKEPTTNNQITNKNYDLILNGGSIFDRNIALDPETARTSMDMLFNSFFSFFLKLKFNFTQ